MSLNVTTGDEGWKKPKTGNEVSMSTKVTKVDGSVDEKNELEYTVGDKTPGLLSTTIDKALKSEEAHLKSSPKYAEGATSDLTLLQKAEKAISEQRKQSQRMSLQRVSQPNRY